MLMILGLQTAKGLTEGLTQSPPTALQTALGCPQWKWHINGRRIDFLNRNTDLDLGKPWSQRC